MSVIFDYKTTAFVSGLMLGSHKSQQRGNGFDFYKRSVFLDEPDISRLDLKASLTDPFESLHVKSFRQRSKIDVLTLVDGSSSMLFANKLTRLVEVFNSIQQSVNAAGDHFHGFLFNQQRHRINDITALQSAFSELKPEQNQAEAFLTISQIIPAKPSLIFIISDFHWPEWQLHAVMTALSAHQIVPVIVWSRAEYQDYPLWRFVELTDLESGRSALVFITPSQRAAIQQRYQRHEQALQQQFRRFNQHPFWLIDNYSAQNMHRYFAMR